MAGGLMTLAAVGAENIILNGNTPLIVYDFLTALGLDKETAELDSEGIEHHVGNKTLNKLKNLTNKLKKKNFGY